MKHAGLAAALLWLGACSSGAEAVQDGGVAEQLAALGYVAWAPIGTDATTRGGVVQHDEARTQRGWNLFSSRALPGAQLVDARGQTVHEWRAADDAAPGWNHVELASNGDLWVIDQAPSLQRLDRKSQVIWRRALAVHHDLATLPDGGVVALERQPVELEIGGERQRILGENLLRLTPDGAELARIPLHDLLHDVLDMDRIATAATATPDPRSVWQRVRELWRPLPADVFHANSVEILPRDVPGLGPKGAALVSLRNLDRVVVVDMQAATVVWSLAPGVVQRQHHASLLPNGHLLVFDNGRERNYSRVVEIDPVSQKIVWEYSGVPARSLRSRSQGGAEALANGNLLVVESERGRAFEITREGEVVWEFLHPSIDAARGARASIYRMTRVTTRP